MQITCSIALTADDTLPGTADEIAAAILQACGGDPAKDVCWLNLNVPSAVAGTPPEQASPAGVIQQ